MLSFTMLVLILMILIAAYEDSYDHDNGSDELNDQFDQADVVGEDMMIDDNDEVIDKGNNPDDASSWLRLVSWIICIVVFYIRIIYLWILFLKFTRRVNELHLHIGKWLISIIGF